MSHHFFARLTLVLIAVAAPSLFATERRHDPPPIALELEVTETELRSSLVIRDVVYREWFGQDPAELPELDLDQLDRVIDEVATFLREHHQVKLDGVRVQPRLRDVFFQESLEENHFLGYVAIDFDVDLKGRVDRIDFRWDWFGEADTVIIDRVDANLALDTHLTQMVFTPREPEYTWHRPELPERPEILPPPPPPTRTEIELPAVSLAIVLGLIGWVIVATRRALPRVAFWIVLAMGVGGAAVATPYGRVPFTPPWGAEPAPPNEDEARRIFESLHRNIYRAFDHDDRDQSYDVLKESVSHHLIEDVYREVFRSLIMQEENGAVSKVRGVDVLEDEVFHPDDERLGSTGFGVRCRWRVTGIVTHSGHSHWRTNEYRAEYRLAALEQGWRIVSSEVLSQERIASDADTPSAD